APPGTTASSRRRRRAPRRWRGRRASAPCAGTAGPRQAAAVGAGLAGARGGRDTLGPSSKRGINAARSSRLPVLRVVLCFKLERRAGAAGRAAAARVPLGADGSARRGRAPDGGGDQRPAQA